MPRYINLTIKSADLATDFGLEWATKLFGAEAIASLPVRQAGKHKGRPKGFVIWRKAAESGYCREVQSVHREGSLVDAWIGAGSMSPRGDAVNGQWLGRVQPLGGSAVTGHFFEEGRQRAAAERAAYEAYHQEVIAETMAEYRAAQAQA